ncbi:glucuronokinase [Salvia divinorum]|uniref:Glucuronokinase n=1 Tax=Salvia divinorum TaxID=28513 RepID=A0ABD1I918_SALDI
MECCCAGRDNSGFEGGSSCRDVMYPHPRVNSCDLLDLIPSSMVLDSAGVHAQTLCSNQATWLNYSHSTLSSQDTIGTRVLIPLSVGLVELFVSDEVGEDEGVMDLIRVQCSFFLEQQMMELPNDISVDSIFLEGGESRGTEEENNSSEEDDPKYRRRTGKSRGREEEEEEAQ